MHHDLAHDLLFPAINLAILLTILVVKLRGPIRDFIRGRHESLREELLRVRELLGQAQARHDEFSGKLKGMDAEIQSLRAQAKQDAAATKSRVLAEAQKLSAAIVSDARAAAQGLHSQLRFELLSDIGVRVLERSETLVRERLTTDDRARIRRDFTAQVEAVR